MTRYTKLERKRHVDAGEAFSVTPLMPAKQVQGSAATTAAPTPKPQGESSKKRKAEDSTSGAPGEKSTGPAGDGGATTGPAKKKNKNNKKKKTAGDKDGKPGSSEQGKLQRLFPLQVGRSKGFCSLSSCLVRNVTFSVSLGSIYLCPFYVQLLDPKSAKSERRRLRRQKERGNASVSRSVKLYITSGYPEGWVYENARQLAEVVKLCTKLRSKKGGDERDDLRKYLPFIPPPLSHTHTCTNTQVCFACRKTGHSAKNCKESTGVGMCYSCGSLEHTTKDCKKLPKDGNKFKFATCFVCKEQGHLAGACPKNEKGLYPKGGSCRFCNKVDHLAKDCTLTKEEVGTVTLGKIDLVQGADDDDFHIFVDEKRKLTEEQKTIKKMVKTAAKPVKKVVSF
jgi:zinc finger CCHC domain-containing protein 9